MEINIAIALNQRYVDYAGVLLKSISCQQPNDVLQVYVLHNKLVKEDLTRIQRIAGNEKLQLHELNVGNFSGIDKLPVTDAWSVETYFRLFMIDLLPESMERILYLDIDIIVNKPIDKLYTSDIENFDFLVCKDVEPLEWQMEKRKEMFKVPFASGYQYFNAGVMLWNLMHLRSHIKSSDYMDQLEIWDYKVTAPDQDLLNFLHWKEVRYADGKIYDYLAREGHRNGDSYEDVKEHAVIVHFVGEKPWEAGCIHFDMEQLWWDYAERTPIYMELLEKFQRETMTSSRLGNYVDKMNLLNRKLITAMDTDKKIVRDEVYLYSEKEMDQSELSFLDLLLDDTKIGSNVYIPRRVYEDVGGINTHLNEKTIYELLLRLAEKNKLIYTRNKIADNGEDWIQFSIEESKMNENRIDCLKTDAYIIGKYSSILQKENYFDAAVEGLLSEAIANHLEILDFLEEMIAHGKAYRWIEEGSSPVLIYKGDMTCYGVLNQFANSFGNALKRKGMKVEYFDLSKQDPHEIGNYAGKTYKAIIGFQSYMFSVKTEDEQFIHNAIGGEKYNFIFDHPIWFQKHLLKTPERFHVMTLDHGYVNFIKKYYGIAADFLPPAGNADVSIHMTKDRDVVFLGTYGAIYDQAIESVRNSSHKYVLNSFLSLMKKHTEWTPEQAMVAALQKYHMKKTNDEIRDLIYEGRWCIHAVFQYYRKRVIQVLLKNDIQVHVYGDSWKKSPFVTYHNLYIHEEKRGQDAMKEVARAKISLNIMAWHKDSFTERIAESMLMHSVVLSDESVYLNRNFTNGEDIFTFSLNSLDQLGEKVKLLLSDTEKREQVAEKAYRKAIYEHTWDRRAEEFLEIMENETVIEG